MPRLNGYGRVWEFNALLKNSTCADMHKLKKWLPNIYGQAKAAIAPDGDGLGRGFIEQFMPSPPHSHTLQNALDSHYTERRKAAAERRKAIAEEQQCQADRSTRARADCKDRQRIPGTLSIPAPRARGLNLCRNYQDSW